MSRELLGKLKTRIPEPRAPVTSRTVSACLSPRNKVNQNNELMMVGSWFKERPCLHVQDRERALLHMHPHTCKETHVSKKKKSTKKIPYFRYSAKLPIVYTFYHVHIIPQYGLILKPARTLFLNLILEPCSPFMFPTCESWNQ